MKLLMGTHDPFLIRCQHGHPGVVLLIHDVLDHSMFDDLTNHMSLFGEELEMSAIRNESCVALLSHQGPEGGCRLQLLIAGRREREERPGPGLQKCL